jgi:integrase
MPTLRLTDENLHKLILPDGSADIFYNDDELSGFKARVRRDADGRVRRTWHLQFRTKTGRQGRVSLGSVDKPAQLSATKARQKATELLVSVRAGDDPQKARKEIRKAHKELLLDCALRYLEDRRGGVVGKRPMSKATYGAAKRCFEKHFAALAKRPVALITDDEIRKGLRRVIEQHGKVAAIRDKSNLSAFFTWAMREGLCKSNPTINAQALAENAPRDRVLDDDELRAIWRACQVDDFGRIVKLLLLLGCRRNEIGGLQWSEINFGTGVLSIPATRTKSRKELRLSLPAVALEILKSVPRRADRQYLFGSSGGEYSRWGYAKVDLDKRLAEAGHHLKPWVLHDLRRTCRTKLSEIGIPPHIAELVLGHVGHRSSVDGSVYDRHHYQTEIQDALQKWADALMKILEGGPKVVPLRATV